MLKRGFANTMEELLMCAEYIMAEGNHQVILCERGIRTFEKYTRNTLDLSAVPVLRRLTHLPIVVDPSHATGFGQAGQAHGAGRPPWRVRTGSSSKCITIRSMRCPTVRSPSRPRRLPS